MEKHRHPADWDLYTPVTPEFYALLDRMKREWLTWRRVCAVSNTRMKVLRNIRTGKRKAVSLTLVDRLVTTTGVGSVNEFVWFTADDLVALGIWKPVEYVDDRFYIDEVTGKKVKKKKPPKKASKSNKAASKKPDPWNFP